MLKQYVTGALLILSMAAYSQTVQAQTTNTNNSNSDSSSTVTTNSNQQASSTNSGVTAMVSSYAPSHTHASVDSQVPLSLGGYAAFSQANCSNSLGVGATTKIFSLVVNAPKPEINCQHVVRSNAFGNEAKLANEMRKPMQAEINRAISVWQACTADLDTTAACIRMNVIRYVDPQHPDLTKTMPYPHFDDQAILMPAADQPAAMSSVQAMPSPPVERTYTKQLAQQSPSQGNLRNTAVQPSSMSSAQSARYRRAQEAVASLTWVQRASGN